MQELKFLDDFNALIEEAHETKWFVNVFYDVATNWQYHRRSIKTDRDIVDFCNDWWMALPDDSSIRTPTFFKLCNIAEHIFDEDRL